jgi:beta-glucanase (GH16 family)
MQRTPPVPTYRLPTAPPLHPLVLFAVPLLTAICTPALAGAAPNWQLVWSDEFAQDGLPDASKWGYDLGRGTNGWGNNEAQYYTDRAENARVENGRLIIEARVESLGGANYTSARMVTRHKGDWLYGRFEIRAKLPTGRGTWPAVWMLPTDWAYGGWPASGEIDIMEHVGYDQGVVHGTIHTASFNHMIGTQRGGSITRSDVSTRFYTYAVEWSADELVWFIDDIEYFRFPRQAGYGSPQWPFDRRFHLILNLAIGGNWGGVQGIDNSALPQTLEVEFVRVYQRVDSPPLTTPDNLWLFVPNPAAR